ncbi:MAG TPA: hypothetical protein VL574_13520 [Stellaceae bacterium]|nr:hypothetical protein [Stellaceae bacterium]
MSEMPEPTLTTQTALTLGLLAHPFERIGPLIWVVSFWTGPAALYLMALAALLIAIGSGLRGARIGPIFWLLLAVWELAGCPFLA